MPELPVDDTWRDTLVTLVELGGIVVIVGAAVFAGLRKAFRFTDAFEGEAPGRRIPPPVAGQPGQTVHPVDRTSPPGGAPGPAPWSPQVKATRIDDKR